MPIDKNIKKYTHKKTKPKQKKKKPSKIGKKNPKTINSVKHKTNFLKKKINFYTLFFMYSKLLIAIFNAPCLVLFPPINPA